MGQKQGPRLEAQAKSWASLEIKTRAGVRNYELTGREKGFRQGLGARQRVNILVKSLPDTERATAYYRTAIPMQVTWVGVGRGGAN